MTVNIGLVTSEALVLGCDSIATASRQFIDPFAGSVAVDSKGKPIKDKDGNLTVPLTKGSFVSVVTDVMPGVAKMFKIYDQNDTYVAATTSGTAALNDRAIASHAADFLSHQRGLKRSFANVVAIAKAFLNHMNKVYEDHYARSKVKREYWDDLSFLVGGIGKNDDMPSLFRVDIKSGKVREEFAPGKHGVAWGGQSDSVERVIRGYDSWLKFQIESEIDVQFDRYRARMTDSLTDIVNNVLAALGASMPSGVPLSLPGPPSAKLGWEKATLDIRYGSLATQRAIDFVSFLVLLQAGPQRFSAGIATVGGRTHVGVVSSEGFKMLNEPVLNHEHIGFSDDS